MRVCGVLVQEFLHQTQDLSRQGRSLAVVVLQSHSCGWKKKGLVILGKKYMLRNNRLK